MEGPAGRRLFEVGRAMTTDPTPDLDAIRERWADATPGPWHVRDMDDDHAMSLTAVSTVPDDGYGWGDQLTEAEAGEIVAVTLLQAPRLASIADGRWDENAVAIAAAPTDIADLLAWGEGLAGENERLRATNAEHVRMIRDLRKAMSTYDSVLADTRSETAAATGGTDD